MEELCVIDQIVFFLDELQKNLSILSICSKRLKPNERKKLHFFDV